MWLFVLIYLRNIFKLMDRLLPSIVQPHHSRFIRDHLTEDQRHDVCLFKQFVKSQHSYGNKSAVGRGGFIGYAAEILICQYDSLLNLFDHFHELQTEIINPVWKLANYTPNDNEIR